MRRIAPLLGALLLLPHAGGARAAFEPVPQSPWLASGPASALYPRTPLALIYSPVATGLLESAGAAASASRPFGLSELDRCAVAGSCRLSGGFTAGAAVTLSGSSRYSEFSAIGGCAVVLVPRVVAGASLALRRLVISGYGSGTGFSGDAGVAFAPFDGIRASGCVRGVFRTDIGESGDPSCPRGVDAALGMSPGRGVTVSVGASRDEHTGMCLSLATSFSPDPLLALGASISTEPLRFSFCLSASVSGIEAGYGYAGHETLPATHSVSLCWGRCASDPEPVDWGGPEGEDAFPGFPLNVNTASREDFERIPGIGPAKASAIDAWLRENGPVACVEELLDVPGVGPGTLRVLMQYLVVE
jgi:competence ComEA-like helix-hairpin-helix protein